MTQPGFSDIRATLATYLDNVIPGLRVTPNRPLQVNPPQAVIMPVQGSFARYSTTFDGETDYTVRVILLVAPADSTMGEDLLDPYIAATGAQSIYAAVQADPSLGGVVSWAAVTEATGYGLMNMNGIDYLACHFIVSIGVLRLRAAEHQPPLIVTCHVPGVIPFFLGSQPADLPVPAPVPHGTPPVAVNLRGELRGAADPLILALIEIAAGAPFAHTWSVMRWLLVHPGPNFSVADVHNGWAEALRGLGEEVMEYNLDARLQFYDSALMPEAGGEPDSEGRRMARKALTSAQAVELAADGLLGACYRWWPHVVVLVSAFFTPPFVLEVMRSRKHRIVMLFTEAPYQTGQQLEMAKFADISLLNDPTGLEEYRAVSRVAEYVPHSYRPSVHYPAAAGTELVHDLCFVGTGFRSRIEFFERMDLSGLAVALRGFWDVPEKSPLRGWLNGAGDSCLDNIDTADLYRASRCGINFYRREAEAEHAGEGWACGPREIEMAACGLFFPRDSRPESDGLFPMLPAFTTPEQAGDLIRWYAAHPAERERRALAAREAVADRTFTNAAKRLLTLLEQQEGKRP